MDRVDTECPLIGKPLGRTPDTYVVISVIGKFPTSNINLKEITYRNIPLLMCLVLKSDGEKGVSPPVNRSSVHMQLSRRDDGMALPSILTE